MWTIKLKTYVKMKKWRLWEKWDVFLIVLYSLVVLTNYCEATTTSADNLLEDKTLSAKVMNCPNLCECNESLKVVNCSNRSLRIIPDNIPVWVKTLSLRNNKITRDTISSYNFARLEHLQKLDIGDNRIVTFASDLGKCTALSILILDHCSLENLPNMGIDGINNVTELYLSHNAISDPGKALSKWPNLKLLDLRFNKLKTIKGAWFSRQFVLEELILERNRISQFEEGAFRGLASIRKLNLARNRIKNLKHLTISATEVWQKHRTKECSGNLTTLEHINLSQNALTYIHGLWFSGMCKLLTLDLRNNKIVKLHAGSFYGPSALKVLKLDNNNITSISKTWLFQMSALQNLSISNNNVQLMEPQCWSYCTGLKHLDMHGNLFSILKKDSFESLSSLEFLTIAHNEINVVEDDTFKGLPKLQQLDLSFNEISSSIEDIRGAFRGLTSIKFISLRSNRILSLSSKVMEGSESMEGLDLRLNNITSIQNLTFSTMKQLKTLYIESTSFLCDCQLSWFPQWLSERERLFPDFTKNVHVQCYHPPALKGRQLMDVQPEEFVCGNHPLPILLRVPDKRVAFRGENVTLECSASASVTEDKSNNSTEETSTQMATAVDATNLHHDISTSEPQMASAKIISNADMSIRWKVDQEVISESSRIRIRNLQRVEVGHVFFTSVLLLSNVNNIDEGKYSCIVTNDYGHMQSTPAQLSVYAYPKFKETPPVSILVKNGSEAVLKCAATGYPAPLIHWQKDGGSEFPAARQRRLLRDATKPNTNSEIPLEFDDYIEGEEVTDETLPQLHEDTIKAVAPSDPVALVTETAPLHIAYVLPEDTGVYACIAKSEAGRIMTTVKVTVLVKPSFEKPMLPLVKSVKGGDSVLQCMGIGYPDPDIQWRFQERPLNHTSRHFLAAEGKLLVIVDTSMADAGDYTCILTNNFGTKRGVSTLKVFKDATELEENGGLFVQLFGNNTTLGIVIICVLATVVIALFIWLGMICHIKNDTKAAYSTGTDDTELHPIEDLGDSDNTSNGKGQASYNSLTDVECQIRNQEFHIAPLFPSSSQQHQLVNERMRHVALTAHTPHKVVSSRSATDLRFTRINNNMEYSTSPRPSIQQPPHIRRYLSNGNFESQQINVNDQHIREFQAHASSHFAQKAADPNTYEQVTFLRPKGEKTLPQNLRRNSASSSTAGSSCNNAQRIRRKKKTKTIKNCKNNYDVTSNNQDQNLLLRHHHKTRRKNEEYDDNENDKVYNSPSGGGDMEVPSLNCDATKREFYPLLSQNDVSRKNSSDISR